jgi:pyrroloquinoline-quinone synthase
MTLLQEIQMQIQNRRMLAHPFYQDWMSGKLSKEQLQNYAHQYLPFVDSFPRFVSATHSQCEDTTARKLLLENLLDEEGFRHSKPHPELWRNFLKGLGASEDRVLGEKAQALEATFMSLCQSSYEEGLCALYAYESQIPEIAKAKIEGLARNYQMKDASAIEFFSVHQMADVYHSRACADLIENVDVEKREVCVSAARKATDALWDFLTEVHH